MSTPVAADESGKGNLGMRYPFALAARRPEVGSRPGRNSVLLLTIRVLVVVLALVLATPVSAYGYADPGTGAFLYQAAYAAFLGIAFYLRKFLNRIGRKRDK